MNKKLPITAIISSCNEASLLERCLSSISFCSEILFLDQQSKDNSKEIAISFNVNYYLVERVKAIEELRSKYVWQANNNWILFVDPDEIYLPPLVYEISDFLKKTPISSQTGIVRLPYTYYFAQYPLKGTIWGKQSIGRLFHRNRTSYTTNIHYDLYVKNGFQIHRIPRKKSNTVQHYWVSSKSALEEKHNNYLRSEGKSLFNRGLRYTFYKAYFNGVKAFIKSYFYHLGFLDGVVGLYLSTFYGQYIYRRWKALKTYEHTQKVNQN